MKKKDLVGGLMVYSTIYDVDLPAKILQEMEREKLNLDLGQSYDVDVLFDTKVFELDEFYSFNVTKPRPAPRGRKKLSESEKKKEKMYEILSEQLDNVIGALKAAGISIRNSAIIGEEHITTFFVDVNFYSLEPEPEVKGKRKSPMGHVNTIMPSRKNFYKNLAEALNMLKEAQDRRIKEEEMEKVQKEQHTPNWYLAEELFSEIAQSMYPFDYEKAVAHKEILYKTAIQVSDWPLHIKSKNKTDGDVPSIDKNTKLDCPEYMMYTQYTTGSWSVEKIENLKVAQNNIVRHGYNLKGTERIVVLHNLKSVPYTLFKETEEGLVAVAPEEAQGEKKLFLSWNK